MQNFDNSININTAFEQELYLKYLNDPNSVSTEWQNYFNSVYNKTIEYIKPADKPIIQDTATTSENSVPKLIENAEALSSIQKKIAENMELSIQIPTASSIREIPVKPLDENRRIINKYLESVKQKKVSFTHILAWAIVRALIKYPVMNDSYEEIDGVPYRIRRNSVNFGIAIDVTRKDGSRLLMVPSIKDAQNMHFRQFVYEMDRLIANARSNKLTLDDLSGATVSITNPGMVGTSHSIPRLMKGQGLIIAVGAIDYPVEFSAVRPEVLTNFAVSKITTLTNTYDHRIIQGAESAEFLSYISKLLLGENYFYDQIFIALNIPFSPIKWQSDANIHNKYASYAQKEHSEKSAHLMLLINAYRTRGHLLADINPLGRASYNYPDLDPAYYGFNIWDLDRYYHVDDGWTADEMPLRNIIEKLRYSYCGKISYEYMHIQSPTKVDWIKNQIENSSIKEYSTEEKKRFLNKLITAEEFENFLHTKFVGHKRFSLEGSESLIVMVDTIMQSAADNNNHTTAIGMPHRGRLNVLVNNAGKPIERVFDEFDGYIDTVVFNGCGDVKYHLGYDSEFTSSKNNKMKVTLLPNPSHLELVNPLVEGVARALDNKIGDKTYTQVLPILIHGDAAFAGQGIVAETLNLSELDGYKTGGTIHIIVNNQIGFTTTSENSRSTVYATDIAKMLQSPIIHVNGNDPEAVAYAAEFAFNFRETFHNDIIIDMLCYRKYGHNEGDEPGYTQPLLYKKIKAMKPISEHYKRQLITEKSFTEEEILQMRRDIQDNFYEIFNNRSPIEQRDLCPITEMFHKISTSVPENTLRLIGEKITTLPDENYFHSNNKVKSLFAKRREMINSTLPAIDWSMAEALAFGSLVIEGSEVRFTGQDSRRGTFSQRHSVLTDLDTEEIYIPINHIQEQQALLRIFDSPLSEVAVLGFEYGYSLINQSGLTLWEAQFGDFANNSQVLIDQYIAVAESKWGKGSNITLLLPHSYEGQGAEHSSGRIERYLQQCADNNMIVANLSTPAQYFHILRRQVKADYRKPLVLFTPKSMLRNHLAVSSLEDLSSGEFAEIIDAVNISNREEINKIIMCSGKVYYDLIADAAFNSAKNTAVVRIEQFYPFNAELFVSIMSGYPNAERYIWLQEEPKNQGAWNYLFPIFFELLNAKVEYVGRAPSPVSANASYKLHNKVQQEIINKALE